MCTRSPVARVLVALLVAFQCCMPPIATSGEILGRVKRLLTETSYHGTKPAMGHDSAMEYLAENIDWLEHHIDTYGSVVAKQPDIWGEARLTKHRDEYERMMFGQLGKFNDTINAAVTQRDNAFLAQAFALSTAAAGAGVETVPTGAGATAINVNRATAALMDVDTDTSTYAQFNVSDTPGKASIDIEPVVHLDQLSRYLQHLHELRRINEGDDTSDSPGYSLNLVRIPVSITPGKVTREGFGAEITITAEPVISDDLMSTTFQNLAINDVVDFVGLPLVRVTEQLELFKVIANIPKSQKLFSDSILTIDRILSTGSDSDELRISVAQILENDLLVETLISTYEKKLEQLGDTPIASRSEQLPAAAGTPTPMARKLQEAAAAVSAREPNILRTEASLSVSDARGGMATDATDKIDNLKNLINTIKRRDTEAVVEHLRSLRSEDRVAYNKFARLTLVELQARAETASVPVSSGRARRALDAINPSTLVDVIGLQNLNTIAQFFEKAYYGRSVRWRGGRDGLEACIESRVDLLDARRYLRSETQAAYELLIEPAHVSLYAKLASPHSMLAAQIRNGHLNEDRPGQPSVASYRRYFFSQLHNHVDTDGDFLMLDSALAPDCVIGEGSVIAEVESRPSDAEAGTPVEALAWAVVVESALLNERLNRDVRKLAKAKEAYSLNTEQDHWFFLPDTVDTPGCGNGWLQPEFQAANEVFKEYVRQRWPIHVFAVDPVNQDQNVADVSQRKRELQFALALGFATGQIGANSLTQYSRALDTQIETIALNRTIVGFGHGSDTFGWRFYPRVQGLDAPGTFGTIRETLMGTSRDYDLKQRKIEPGQRECVAVVLMPSFVPYADFDIRTDWFKLTNPKNTALTMKSSLKLSRAVTAMRNSRAQCAEYQHLYREGELRRLFKRVDQLDRELPLQTMRSLVPYENTLGGFEMFNTGVTDLSPELIGWYGAPGVRTTGTNCGCARGCLPAPGATCDDPASCEKLYQTLQALNATIAASPVPACEGEGTTLFLVGDNFSVHDTKVIAGGTCIPHVRLISRELMQVTIPSCVNTVELCEGQFNRKYVAIYVATPYGVTNHLHVPIMEQPSTACCSSSGVTQAPKSVLDQHTVGLSSAVGDSTRGASPASVLTSLASDHSLQPPVRLSSMLQETRGAEDALVFEALSKQIEDLKARIEQFTPAANQTQVDVNIRYPQAMAERSHRGLFEEKELPMLSRFKTSATERWRNYRDQLPGN